MEEAHSLNRESPRKYCSIFSKLFFTWMINICVEGNSAGIDVKKIYKISENYESKKLADNLQEAWDRELEHGKLKGISPNLFRVIFKTYSLEYFYWGLLIFFNSVGVRMVQPLALGCLIKLFVDGGYSTQEVLFYSGALCALTLTSSLLIHHYNRGAALVGMKARIAVSSLIYRKILKLSQLSLGQTASGPIVNLLSNDVIRFDLAALVLNYLWIAPIQLIVVTCLMWMKMGPSSLVGITFMLVVTVPVQMLMGLLASRFRSEIAQKTDLRVSKMSEIIAGIQVIKMFAWEIPFKKIVENARREEIKSISKASYVKALQVSTSIFIERAALAVTLTTYFLLGHEIKSDLIFTLYMYFNYLRLTLAVLLPVGLTMGAETLVSIKRLQEFLMMEEKQTCKILQSENNAVGLKNVNASWAYPIPTLRNINLKLLPGSLCAVIGPIGSGKSSLLKLLLGELEVSSGFIELSGKVSYASQNPWLFSATVRNNILFGEEYNRIHYRNVVKMCALDHDFRQLPANDKTKVGDRAISLSGGQRARINLARAVYRKADVYLLDDPLSAVDTKVGKHLFDRCIYEFLAGKTRILVTHQLQYLKKADTIIVLREGSIEAHGTFESLSQSDIDFTKLLIASDETSSVGHRNIVERTMSVKSTSSITGDFTEEIVMSDVYENQYDYKGSSLWAYIRCSENFALWIGIWFLFVVCQALLTGSDYWVTIWAKHEQLRSFANTSEMSEIVIENIEVFDDDIPNSLYEYTPAKSQQAINSSTATKNVSSLLYYLNDGITDHIVIARQDYVILTSEFLISVYIVLVTTAIILVIVRSLAYFYACMKSSNNLHNRMFHGILESRMRFFDINPTGRILNRFSKDIGTIDECLPPAWINVIQVSLIVSGSLFMVSITNPYVVIIMGVLIGVFFLIRKWFITVARSIKLVEGIAKSPVYSFINSSVDGLTTIRATGNAKILQKQFDEHQNVHSSAWYLTVLCSTSFGLWLDLICLIFIVSVIGSFVILDRYIQMEGNFIGLGISQSLILVGMLQFGMRQQAETVNHLTSVERVLEYSNLEKEHPLESLKDKEKLEQWPSKGRIVFEKVFLRYKSDDLPVLNNLNINILPTEKIGIVGRTGAGKSSLIAALFQLAPTEGKILIDDVNLKTIGLRDLRKRISIIPQEPVLFSASLRYNLDPFNEFEDYKLWKVLDEVELKDKFESLDFEVTEGGNNFSVGQRQLVCLARAMLRDNKILVLDEATANVDPKTDELIQQSLRKTFKNCTVLTIAHRLNTVMDSDKILVVHKGQNVEFDHPHILLQNPEGYLSKILEEAGPTMIQTLRKIASTSYDRKIAP